MASGQQNEVVPTEVPGPQIVVGAAFVVLGLHGRTSNAAELSGLDGKIGPLWNRLLGGDGAPIPGVLDSERIYAVYTGYESDEQGMYDVVVGRSVNPDQTTPVGMEMVHLSAGKYLVFLAIGKAPQRIQAAWKNVYEYFRAHPEQRRAFTADFEEHSPAATRLFIALR